MYVYITVHTACKTFFMKYIENLTNLPLVGTLICCGRSVMIDNTDTASRRGDAGNKVLEIIFSVLESKGVIGTGKHYLHLR